MYILDDAGNRVYTLKVGYCAVDLAGVIAKFAYDCIHNLQKEDKAGTPTNSAHPARFSPDDKFSRERIMGKKRFNLLPTQVNIVIL